MAGFQQVIVLRDLDFSRGAAAYQPNVKGPIMTELKIFDETFMADSDEHDWNEEEVNGVTIAHSAADAGAMTMTAGGTDDDCGELSHTAQWTAAKNCGVEVWLKISQITSICVAAGFVDAKTATNDRIAMEMDAATLKNMTGTADCCGLLFDTDATTGVWYCVAANNGTEGTPVAALGSLAPVAATYVKLRIQTDSTGKVAYYYNGVAVGSQAAAIAAASTDLLTPYVGFISRSTAAAVCTIARITTWQEF